MHEANYGTSIQLFQEKRLEEAVKLLIGVVREPKVAPEVRAPAMLLLARINEEQGDVDSAINNYIKVDHMFGSGVPEAAAESLWRGADLLLRQSKGEAPLRSPKEAPKTTPKPAAGEKPAEPAAAPADKPAGAAAKKGK